MSDIEIPDNVKEWAVNLLDSRPSSGPSIETARWIVSLLPPPPPPNLRDKIHALLDGYTTSDATNYLTGEILEIVRADIKENFGWETRITSYLKGQ